MTVSSSSVSCWTTEVLSGRAPELTPATPDADDECGRRNLVRGVPIITRVVVDKVVALVVFMRGVEAAICSSSSDTSGSFDKRDPRRGYSRRSDKVETAVELLLDAVRLLLPKVVVTGVVDLRDTIEVPNAMELLLLLEGARCGGVPSGMFSSIPL